MNRIRYGLAAGIVAGLVAASMLLGVAAPAHAVGELLPLNAPPPINVLPSVIQGAVSGMPGETQVAAQLLYGAQKDPRFWNYVKFVEEGTATAAERAVVDAGKASSRFPLTKFAPLLRTVGTVTAPIAAYQTGVMMGHGVAEMVGLDPDGQVCTNGPSGVAGVMVVVLSGVNCIDFENRMDEIMRNAEVAQVWDGETLCFQGTCVAFETYIAQYQSNCGQGGGTGVRGTGSGPNSWAQVYMTVNGRVLFHENIMENGKLVGLTSCAMLIAQNTGPVESLRFVVGRSQDGPGKYTESNVEGTKGNPSRHFRTTVRGSDGKDYVREGERWTDNDPVFHPPVAPKLPPMVNPVRTTIDEVVDDVAILDKRLSDLETTPEALDALSKYPECTEGICALELISKTALRSCHAMGHECAEWFTDPDKGAKYECRYGTHIVPMTECEAVYRDYYKSRTDIETPTLTDPKTGTPLPSPKTPKDPLQFQTPIQDPAKQRVCMPTGWAMLNPIEWVMKPVQCALEWAFVPRQSQMTATLNRINTAPNGKAPAAIMTAVAGWQIRPPTSGCNGITVNVPFLGPPFQIMKACPGDMLAPMAMWARVFGNITFTVFGVVALTRHIARVFGFDGIGAGGDT